MGIIGSLLYVLLIWWIIFQFYRLNSIKKVFKEKIGSIDPGAQKILVGKKFLITTLITTIIFSVIYYFVSIDLLNLREFLK